jgi:hypothetical protein
MLLDVIYQNETKKDFYTRKLTTVNCHRRLRGIVKKYTLSIYYHHLVKKLFSFKTNKITQTHYSPEILEVT